MPVATLSRLERLLAPYRDLSNQEMRAQLKAYLDEHRESRFPSTHTLNRNARILMAGKRYRFALAVSGYEGLSGRIAEPPVVQAATWLEWYHLYTLFLDDIMDEDVRRRRLPSAWHANAQLYRGKDGSDPGIVFRDRRARYGGSQAILDALRIRSLAERAIQRASGLGASLRERLLEELTEVDLVLSEGQGLDIDFENAPRITEDEYERMSERKTGRLYVSAATTAAVLASADAGEQAALEMFARHFSAAFQDRDDLLGAGIVRSEIGGSSMGDIRNGKRTRLFAMAIQRIPDPERAAFLGSYGRGRATTAKDIARVRSLLKGDVLDAMNARISSSVSSAVAALDRIHFHDESAKDLLTFLARVQLVRVS